MIKNTSKPISVLMPVRNSMPFILEAINSILSQSFTDFELIIIDDGSTDSTFKTVAKFASDDKRIKLIKNTGRGISSALNLGLLKSKGAFIARMDSDDICMPNRFQEQVDFLLKNPDIGAVGAQVKWVDKNANFIGNGNYPIHWKDCEAFLSLGTSFCHPTMMIRRQLLESCNGYRSDFDGAEDIDLWLRLSNNYKLANLPSVQLHYRVHETNFSKCWKDQAIAKLLTARGQNVYSELFQNIKILEPITIASLLNSKELEPARVFFLFHLFVYMALVDKPKRQYLKMLPEFVSKFNENEFGFNRSIHAYWMLRLARSCYKHSMMKECIPLYKFLLFRCLPETIIEVIISLTHGSKRKWSRVLSK